MSQKNVAQRNKSGQWFPCKYVDEGKDVAKKIELNEYWPKK